MSVYAFICRACNHRVVKHTSKDGDAPFRCAFCPCEVTQDSPVRELSRREYEAWAEKNPEPVGDSL